MKKKSILIERRSKVWSFIAILIVGVYLGCGQVSTDNNQYLVSEAAISDIEEDKSIVPEKQLIPVDSIDDYTYFWKDNYDFKSALVNRITVPQGFKRIEVEKGSFADWLRHLPLEKGEGIVNYYNGDPKYSQSIHAAVVDMDVGKRDLQQCADAIMRVKAEFHYQKQEYSKIHFNFTSGDNVSFDDWRKGRKPRINGNKVTFTNFSGSPDNSYANFKKYLVQIFSYAGTASLEKELIRVPVSDMRPGDLFIQGGSPGHAILVMDMAVNKSTGETLFLLAQSYMPAQDFHILRNYNDGALSPWYSTGFGADLDTPEWHFTSNDLHRFRD